MAGIEEWFQQGQQVQDDLTIGGTSESGGRTDQPSTSGITDWMAQGDSRLRMNMQKARKENPDMRAEVLRLQGKTGLPPDLIQRNMDMVREQAAAKDFDPKRFRQDFPKLAGLLEDPDNATLAQDDMESLQLLEGSLKLNQQRYLDSTTMGQRLWDRVREGALSLRQSLSGIGLVEPIERGAEAARTGDVTVATDPITGMPIPASQVTVTDEQQQQLTESAIGMGTAAEQEMAERLAPLQQRMRDIPQRPATQEMMKAETWGEVFSAFSEDPLGVIADIGISSTTQQLPSLALIMATRNPLVAIGASAGNVYTLETGNGIMQYLAKQGVDTADPAAIMGALEDDQTAADAVTFAEQRGAVMGAAGGLAAGLAPRVLVPSRAVSSESAREALNVFAAQPVAQGIIGSGSEAFLQSTQEGQIAPGELLAEFVGEFAGAPLEAGAFAADRISRRAPQVVEDASKARAAADNAETLEAMGQAAQDSKLRERSPGKLREFVEKMREGSGIESLQVPVERWNELHQARGEDPAEAAADATGDPKQYAEAVATGGDLVIPMDQYMEKLAASDKHEELSQDIRLHPGDMTQREAQEWMAGAQENIQQYVDTLADQPADPSQAVYDDVFGQLLSAGRDRTTADREAQVMQAVFRTLGQRTGQDPAELFQRYNINITRPMPEILQNLQDQDVDVDIDPILDRLRAGDEPTQRDAFGPSLLDFLRERGIRDEGGGLAARDVDAQRQAFQRAIIQDEGMTLDDAAQAAAEANYLPGIDRDTATYQDLLDAMDRELRGDPVFATDAGDQQVQNMRATMQEIGDYLEQLGVDLETMDNASIRALLRGEQPAGEAQPTDDAVTLEQERVFTEDELVEMDVDELDRMAFGVTSGEVVDVDPANLEILYPDDLENPREAFRQGGMDWANSVDLSEPIEVSVDEQGQMGVEDGHHRYFAALQRGESLQAEVDVKGNPVRAILRRQEDAEQTLEQRDREPRGRITFPQSRRFFNIELLESANLSTFFHEGGHLYLEIMRDLAQQEGAPAQIQEDFQTILDWLGVDDADSIGTEQHEQWARGFEAYIMEGRAPSADLRSAFSRFRAWMVAIYRTIQNLGVTLTDEVRGVMDRMLATDEEIAEAAAEPQYQQTFQDAETAGMSEAEFRAYQQSVERARTAAEEELTQKVMNEYQRERRMWWREARTRMRDEVAAEVNQRPEYVAMSVLGRGKMPDGSELPEGIEPFKLNRAALVDRYGKEFLKRLPRPYVYSREGGVHPDVAADMFGYHSGDELVTSMIEARPRRQLIEAETQRRMLDEYGDILNDGSMPDEATAALENERQADVMKAEIRALNRRSGRQPTPANVLRDAATRIIAEKQVRQVRPGLYLRAEQKAANEAFNRLADDDYRGAAEAKQRQLLNHYLYREARQARDDVDSVVDYMAKFRRKPVRQRLAKAGGEYLEQIDALATRYEFRRGTTLRQIDRRRSLEAWVAEQNEQGFTIDVPDQVLDDARVVNYREVSVEELRGMRDSVRQIEHLARTKNKLLAEREKRDFQERVDSIVSSIDASHTRNTARPPLAEDWKDRIASWAKDAHAWHAKPEFLFRWLDGDREAGPVWQALFRPLADAEVEEQRLQRETTEQLQGIMSAYTRKERAEWYGRKTFIPAVNESMNKATMISVALNWGNAYNRDVLMEGYGWNERQVDAILSNLDQRDWETVQAIWDLIDQQWPRIKALEEDLNGLAPEKVEAMEVQTRHGTFRGGYYPIKYDPRASHRTFQREEKAGESLFENSYSRPATRKGHTKERQGSGGQLLRLDLNVMSEHFSQVIHDVTHRRAIMDVNRLANSDEVRSAIEQTAGSEMYQAINPWLQSLANEQLQPESFWEKLVGRARVGATVVHMALKASTAIVQPLGFFSSVDVLGERYAWKGLNDFLGGRGEQGSRQWGSMRRSTDFVLSRSEAMRNRQTTFDRDVRDSLQRMTQETRAQELGRFYFYFTGLMDMAVSVPTWLGAYRKAMEGQVDGMEAGNEPDAISYADSIVRQSQSAGGVKDLARIQRGGPVQRAFVMFYSFFSVLYNQSARRISQARRGEISLPRLAASAMYLWLVPALLGEIIAGRGPDDDEEWAGWAARQWIMYPMGSVVGLRDVSNAVLTPYGYDASPAYDAFSMTARTAKIPFTIADPDDEVTRADVKSAILTAGYWGKLPSRQAWITGEYIYDLATGEEDPENPQEFVRNLFFSRPADER